MYYKSSSCNNNTYHSNRKRVYDSTLSNYSDFYFDLANRISNWPTKLIRTLLRPEKRHSTGWLPYQLHQLRSFRMNTTHANFPPSSAWTTPPLTYISSLPTILTKATYAQTLTQHFKSRRLDLLKTLSSIYTTNRPHAYSKPFSKCITITAQSSISIYAYCLYNLPLFSNPYPHFSPSHLS